MKSLQKTIPGILVTMMTIFSACKKEEKTIPPNPDIPTDLKIEAKVPPSIYSNKKEILMDASTMKALNDNRPLKYLWTCTQFPPNKSPFIVYPESVSTPVTNLDTGKYVFNLWAKDSYGNEANANYSLIVYPDTLTGPPIIPAMNSKIIDLPKPVYLVCENLYQVNPVNRELKVSWTVVDQPAGSPALTLRGGNNGFAEVLGCVAGKYTFQIEVTNELKLKTTSLLYITILADPLSGTTKIYDNLFWTSFPDDMGSSYTALKITDPQLSYEYRNKENAELSFWDFTNQVWMMPNTSQWYGASEGIYVYNDSARAGTPARVKITFK